MEEGSAVFCGHRPLGYVANRVPLVTIRRAKVNLATTALSPLTIIKVIVTQIFQYFKVVVTQIFQYFSQLTIIKQ